jgi:putative hemolysin
VINGVFAGAEIAVVSLRESRLVALIDEGNKRARAVKRLRDDPETFLATTQIGVTVVNVIASAFGGVTFAAHVEPSLRDLPWIGAHAQAVALGLSVALVSYLSLVVGELIPKSLALRYAERYALFIGGPLLSIARVARPLVRFLTWSSNLVLKLFGDRTTFTEARLSPDELQQLVIQAARSGSLDPTAGEIASRALEFAPLTAGQVMVPRQRVLALRIDTPIEEVRRRVAAHGHTRMPIWEESPDQVVGYANVKDLFASERAGLSLRDVLRPAFFVGEPMRGVEVLAEMKRRRIQLVVVVDEAGAMSGIVTLEDLVEEIVGDVQSEHETAPPPSIHPETPDSFLVRGDTPVRDVNRELGLDLPEGEEWSTIAGLCLEIAGKIPEVGSKLAAPDGTVLEIAEGSERVVKAVRVSRPRPRSEPG